MDDRQELIAAADEIERQADRLSDLVVALNELGLRVPSTKLRSIRDNIFMNAKALKNAELRILNSRLSDAQENVGTTLNALMAGVIVAHVRKPEGAPKESIDA